MNRKVFSALGGIILAGYVGIGVGCKSPTTPEPPKPVQVTLQFDVYNHTQGSRGSFTKTAMSGDNIVVRVNELNVNDVDPQRIAIREDNFGNLVRFSNAGEASFTAPKQDMSYDVILFNSTNNAPYQWMDDKNSKLAHSTKNLTVYRKDFDGQTGPEKVWGGEFIPEIGAYGVFDQLNQALDQGWVKWGYINRQPTATSGNFSYGYGAYGGWDGAHAGSWITVNIVKLGIIQGCVAVGLEEAFENITATQNIGGKPSSMTIQHWGVLNPVGKDLFAYAFAKS